MVDYLTSFVNTDLAVFPDTQAVNVSAPGAGDGTEFVAIMVNDVWGRAQALMDRAGLTPDGVTEAPGTAQFLSALSRAYAIGPGIGVTYWKAGTPAANGDRVLLLQGQVILMSSYPLLAAAVYVGDPNNATAPAFYKTSDAGGTTRDTAGTYMVLPDARGLSLKNIGDATISGRTKTGPASLGEVQEDQMQAFQAGIQSGGNTYWGRERINNFQMTGGVIAGDSGPRFDTAGQGNATMITAQDDGTNGTPRTGLNTRDSVLGTNFGITY